MSTTQTLLQSAATMAGMDGARSEVLAEVSITDLISRLETLLPPPPPTRIPTLQNAHPGTPNPHLKVLKKAARLFDTRATAFRVELLYASGVSTAVNRKVRLHITTFKRDKGTLIGDASAGIPTTVRKFNPGTAMQLVSHPKTGTLDTYLKVTSFTCDERLRTTAHKAGDLGPQRIDTLLLQVSTYRADWGVVDGVTEAVFTDPAGDTMFVLTVGQKTVEGLMGGEVAVKFTADLYFPSLERKATVQALRVGDEVRFTQVISISPLSETGVTVGMWNANAREYGLPLILAGGLPPVSRIQRIRTSSGDILNATIDDAMEGVQTLLPAFPEEDLEALLFHEPAKKQQLDAMCTYLLGTCCQLNAQQVELVRILTHNTPTIRKGKVVSTSKMIMDDGTRLCEGDGFGLSFIAYMLNFYVASGSVSEYVRQAIVKFQCPTPGLLTTTMPHSSVFIPGLADQGKFVSGLEIVAPYVTEADGKATGLTGNVRIGTVVLDGTIFDLVTQLVKYAEDNHLAPAAVAGFVSVFGYSITATANGDVSVHEHGVGAGYVKKMMYDDASGMVSRAAMRAALMVSPTMPRSAFTTMVLDWRAAATLDEAQALFAESKEAVRAALEALSRSTEVTEATQPTVATK